MAKATLPSLRFIWLIFAVLIGEPAARGAVKTQLKRKNIDLALDFKALYA